MVELPYQQVRSSQPGLLLETSLFSFEFIQAKIEAGLSVELFGDYLSSINLITAKIDEKNYNYTEDLSTCLQKLKQFYQFLLTNMHVFVRNPVQLLMAALNEPDRLWVCQLAKVQRKQDVHSKKVRFC